MYEQGKYVEVELKYVHENGSSGHLEKGSSSQRSSTLSCPASQTKMPAGLLKQGTPKLRKKTEDISQI